MLPQEICGERESHAVMMVKEASERIYIPILPASQPEQKSQGEGHEYRMTGRLTSSLRPLIPSEKEEDSSIEEGDSRFRTRHRILSRVVLFATKNIYHSNPSQSILSSFNPFWVRS